MHHCCVSSPLSAAAADLARGDVTELLSASEFAFKKMLEGFARQQASRGLRDRTISNRDYCVRRFAEFCGTYPWEWTAADLEEFSMHLLNASPPIAVSSVRSYQNTIAAFCAFANDPDYGWPEVLVERWQATVAQISTPWNTVRHLADFEGKPARRPFTYEELQVLFDTADERFHDVSERKTKGALAALRDSQMLKTTYAFGLRRAEVVGLQLHDLHHNHSVPHWGRFAALHVRFGKAMRGGPPRRRTVFAVVQFAWAVEGLRHWVDVVRPHFPNAANQPTLWPTERGTAVTPRYLDDRFSAIRDAAGLDPALTLHSLRHSYVTHLIEHGYSERFVQEQVGHRHASTTTIYTAVSDDYKRRAISAALERITKEVAR